MTIGSLNDLNALIKQLINTQEALMQNLMKINSFLHIALNEAFLNNSHHNLYNFIWVLSDIAEATLILSEKSINQLLNEEKRLKGELSYQ